MRTLPTPIDGKFVLSLKVIGTLNSKMTSYFFLGIQEGLKPEKNEITQRSL
jgi:hypothetical protein